MPGAAAFASSSALDFSSSDLTLPSSVITPLSRSSSTFTSLKPSRSKAELTASLYDGLFARFFEHPQIPKHSTKAVITAKIVFTRIHTPRLVFGDSMGCDASHSDEEGCELLAKNIERAELLLNYFASAPELSMAWNSFSPSAEP